MDGWVSPTCPFLPMPVGDLTDPKAAQKSIQASRNTPLGNIFRLCAITTPVHQFGSALPVGLQVMCPLGRDKEALSIGLALEGHFGLSARPDSLKTEKLHFYQIQLLKMSRNRHGRFQQSL